MIDFEALAGRAPETLTDEERFRLGMSFYNASRREHQQIAESLGVTAGDAIGIAFERKRNGQSVLDWYTETPE